RLLDDAREALRRLVDERGEHLFAVRQVDAVEHRREALEARQVVLLDVAQEQHGGARRQARRPYHTVAAQKLLGRSELHAARASSTRIVVWGVLPSTTKSTAAS